ncbi:hypothetical protein [uncultured Tateyamaria sp.]|uniref:hypothetical protein n=1 Tax=uncultured Tateyamaria sp. TaxID=455651 RepID=UPI00263723C1|nr:hypothetical protein [uncultured Tateyamaria sp.]
MRLCFVILALFVPQLAAAQDQAAFETALGECARYVVAQPEAEWTFQTPPASTSSDEGGTDASVVYPVGSGGNFDFAVSYSHYRGTSTTPGTWNCAGVGPKSPLWPQFNITGWIGADARLRAAGLVELKFPPPQRAYANCTAEMPDVYVLFNAGEGDRVVFAATTGPAAAAFCTSMGWKG